MREAYHEQALGISFTHRFVTAWLIEIKSHLYKYTSLTAYYVAVVGAALTGLAYTDRSALFYYDVLIEDADDELSGFNAHRRAAYKGGGDFASIGVIKIEREG